jgi:polyribonucleotide nucleotidyltransferase
MSNIGFQKTFDIGDGREITIETGKLAKQADGSVVVRMGNAMLLATVVSSKEAKQGIDFLPLSVDYQEKYASAGRFPGGFLKREGRLSDHEVLICRLVDRALRPLFPDHYHHDTQVMISMISNDPEVSTDALAAFAASAALTVSDIPFQGPISECRVAQIDGKMMINPKTSDLERATLNMIIAATESDVMMVEGEFHESSEDEMIEAIKAAHDAIKIQIQAQKELREMCGAPALRALAVQPSNDELLAKIADMVTPGLREIAGGAFGKDDRAEKTSALKSMVMESLEADADEETKFLAGQYFAKTKKKVFRDYVLETGKRLDGRETTEVRAIWSEVNYLPSAHGSAIFTRGETQSLTTVTLGAKDDEQLIDSATYRGYKKFLLHYNFPGFSTGEVRPNRGPGRREVGHGNLALRALQNVLPEDNPYTIRVVSDILESNGSSSMATVCAGTLALMDAGIDIKAPVSGIAMGMISDPETGKYAILSDILGDEDHLGDMDFKVTGTEKGITATQMDIKIDGLSYEVLGKALTQAKEGRLHILNEIKKTLDKPNGNLKPHAPRIVNMIIEKEFIGAIIGPGGKIIQEMQAETGANINIEEKDGKGHVQIFADNEAAVEDVKARIKGITQVPEVGEEYMGKVKSIMPYGAFVEIIPGTDGLLHISEVDWKRIETLEGVLKEGDLIKVKLIDVDKRSGKLKLSRKVLLPKPEKNEANEANEA